jgi:hypothetical protein
VGMRRAYISRFLGLLMSRIWHLLWSQQVVLPALILGITAFIQWHAGEWSQAFWRIAFPYIVVIGIVWAWLVIKTAIDLHGQLTLEADQFKPRIVLPSGALTLKPQSTVPGVVVVVLLLGAMILVEVLAFRAASLSPRRFPRLRVTAFAASVPQHETSALGGIKWDGKTGDVRVYIENTGQVSAENVNLLLTFNVTMFAAAQLTMIPGVRTEVVWIGPVKELAPIVEDEHGRRFTVPGTRLAPTVRVTSQRIEAGDALRIVAAIDAMYGARLTKLGQTPTLLSVSGTYEHRHEDGQISVLQAEYAP